MPSTACTSRSPDGGAASSITGPLSPMDGPAPVIPTPRYRSSPRGGRAQLRSREVATPWQRAAGWTESGRRRSSSGAGSASPVPATGRGGRRVQDTDLPALLPALEAATAGRDAGEGLVRFLETMPAAFCFLDARWRFGYVNAEAERLMGRSREPSSSERRSGTAFPRVRGTVVRGHLPVGGGDRPAADLRVVVPRRPRGLVRVPGLARYRTASPSTSSTSPTGATREMTARLAGARAALLAQVSAELSGQLDTRVRPRSARPARRPRPRRRLHRHRRRPGGPRAGRRLLARRSPSAVR